MDLKVALEAVLQTEKYALYVYQNLNEFTKQGITVEDLPIVFKTLAATGIKPMQLKFEYPPTQSRTLDFVLTKRKEYEASAPKINGLSIALLNHCFNCINTDFFDGVLPLPVIAISSRLTNAAAYYCCRNGIHEITFSLKRYEDAFSNGKIEAMSSGIRCKNRTQYVEITMEHEILHYAINYSEFVKDNSSLDSTITGSHGLLFCKLAEQLFHHKSTCCNTDNTTDLAQFTRTNLNIGETIYFRCKKNIERECKIKHLNEKTATVTCGQSEVRVPYSLVYKK